MAPRQDGSFKGRYFTSEVILWALRWYLALNPRTITVDKNAAYPRTVADIKLTGELWLFSKLQQRKHLNNILEQDHRRIKRLVRPGLGFGGLETAKRTLVGYEAMAMIRKGQVHNVGGRDMQAQATVVAGLFEVAV